MLFKFFRYLPTKGLKPPRMCLLFHLQTLAALPDQDSFYDMVDGLEEQGMETVSQRHLGRKGTDLDLVEQLNIYEV